MFWVRKISAMSESQISRVQRCLAASRRQQILHAQIDAIEIRQQRPLHFNEVLSGRTIKRAFVTSSQPPSFDGRDNVRGRAISNFSESLLRSLKVRRRNQEVEIRKTPQPQVPIKR